MTIATERKLSHHAHAKRWAWHPAWTKYLETRLSGPGLRGLIWWRPRRRRDRMGTPGCAAHHRPIAGLVARPEVLHHRSHIEIVQSRVGLSGRPHLAEHV